MVAELLSGILHLVASFLQGLAGESRPRRPMEPAGQGSEPPSSRPLAPT